MEELLWWWVFRIQVSLDGRNRTSPFPLFQSRTGGSNLHSACPADGYAEGVKRFRCSGFVFENLISSRIVVVHFDRVFSLHLSLGMLSCED